MANKRKAAIVAVGLVAIVGVAVMAAWLGVKKVEPKVETIGSTRRAKSG